MAIESIHGTVAWLSSPYLADARLIAAAPTLLNALREAAAHIESLTFGYQERHLSGADINALIGRARQARAAIRLTEGE